MKVKTSELTDIALDWAVSRAKGIDAELNYGECVYWDHERNSNGKVICANSVRVVWNPSTNWAQGGPIIEREGISTRFAPADARGVWYAVLGKNRFLSPDFEGSGPTPLIAAMRCYVASKLGDDVAVPENLKG